jgi:uncharacterized membrane protein
MSLMYVFLFLVGAALAFVVRVWGMALLTSVAAFAVVAHGLLNGWSWLAVIAAFGATILASNTGYFLASLALHYRHRNAAVVRRVDSVQVQPPRS